MHLVGFIIRIYHDARSPERQKKKKNIYIYIYIYIYICDYSKKKDNRHKKEQDGPRRKKLLQTDFSLSKIWSLAPGKRRREA